MPKVSKRLRYEILRRDGFKCRYCGTVAATTELRVDHVIPEALGGTSQPSNLAASCDPCNSGKSSTPPDGPIVEDVAEGALRWTHAMQSAASLMENQILARRAKNAFFAEIWNCYKLDNGDKVPLPDDWEGAVVRLESAGLTQLLFEEAAEAAMRAFGVQPENRFRYFCGVAWNMITQLQETAQQITSGESADEDGQTVNAYEGLSRSKLEEHVWRFEGAAENLLTQVPVWAHESSERSARHDWYCAGEPDAPRLDQLPDVLRHLGDVLGKSDIQPQRDGA